MSAFSLKRGEFAGAIRVELDHVHRRLGPVGPLPRPALPSAQDLWAAINDIAEGRAAFRHFKGILSRDECAVATRAFQQHVRRQVYTGAENIGRIGKSLFETQFPGVREAYFSEALAHIGDIRAIFGDRRNPMDWIRCLLDEGSPKGANLFRIGGRTCNVGLIRFQEALAWILAHLDHAGWDVADSIEAQLIECQISILFVLSTPAAGGDTTIYTGERLSKPRYDSLRLPPPNAYAIDSSRLRQETTTFRGEVGDLILFDARFPHSASPPIGGDRYTLSCFYGVTRDGRGVLFS